MKAPSNHTSSEVRAGNFWVSGLVVVRPFSLMLESKWSELQRMKQNVIRRHFQKL